MTMKSMGFGLVMAVALGFSLSPSLAAEPANTARGSVHHGGAGWPDRSYGANGIVRLEVPARIRAQDVVVRPSGAALALASGNAGTFAWRIDPQGAATPLAGTTARVSGPSFRGVRVLDSPSGGWFVIGNRGQGTDQRPAVLSIARDGSISDVTGEVTGAEPASALRVTDAVIDPGSEVPRIVFVGWQGGSDRDDRVAVIGRWDTQGGNVRQLNLGPVATWLSSLTVDQAGNFLTTGSARDPQGGYGYPLVKFDSELKLLDGFPNGVLIDPRELCQFAMADITIDGADNVVAGSTWACQPMTDVRAAVVAQQFPTGMSNEPFGSYGDHQGEGAVAFNFVPGVDWSARAVAIDSRGRIVVAGTARFTPPGGLGPGFDQQVTRPRPLSNRLTSDGDFDPDFAPNALARADGAWTWDVVDVGVDSADQPILIGTATSGATTQIRLVRLDG